MITVFPVRHLSPAGARFAVMALDRIRPDIVLLEIPRDMTPYLPLFLQPGTKPPVALAAYDPADPARQTLLPLGNTSPELAVLRWCYETGVPVRGMDLPCSRFACYDGAEPMGAGAAYERFAALSGEDCFDDFWERTFEHLPPEADYIGAVMAFGQALRDMSPPSAFFWEREESMRGEIARAAHEGFGGIFALCGAYHAPALAAPLPSPSLPYCDAPYRFCLIPYSDARLCVGSGYGGGNGSPRYHELLQDCGGNPERVSTLFLTQIGRWLREKQYPIGTADVLDAVAMAHALSAVRAGDSPVLSELRAAAFSCFHAHTEDLEEAFRLFSQGDTVGFAPSGSGRPPLSEDFHKDLRRLGLANTGRVTLRLEPDGEPEPSRDRLRSRFLHCLTLLEIPYARKEPSSFNRSHFREDWALTTPGPETEAALLACSAYGATVCEAAAERLRDTAAPDIPALAQRLVHCAECGFWEMIPDAVTRLDALTARETDIGTALPVLRSVGQLCAAYPDQTQSALFALLERLFLRCCLSLRRQRKESEFILLTLSEIAGQTGSLPIRAAFEDLLCFLAESGKPAAAGCAFALLFRAGDRTDTALVNELSCRLSPALSEHFPAWLEGFLPVCGGHEQERLWKSMDEALDAMPDKIFDIALPSLRRAFLPFSPESRRNVWDTLLNIEPERPSALSAAELDALLGLDFSSGGKNL